MSETTEISADQPITTQAEVDHKAYIVISRLLLGQCKTMQIKECADISKYFHPLESNDSVQKTDSHDSYMKFAMVGFLKNVMPAVRELDRKACLLLGLNSIQWRVEVIHDGCSVYLGYSIPQIDIVFDIKENGEKLFQAYVSGLPMLADARYS